MKSRFRMASNTVFRDYNRLANPAPARPKQKESNWFISGVTSLVLGAAWTFVEGKQPSWVNILSRAAVIFTLGEAAPRRQEDEAEPEPEPDQVGAVEPRLRFPPSTDRDPLWRSFQRERGT